MPTADGVRLDDETSSVGMDSDSSQNFTPMIGSTLSIETLRCSSVFASWVAPQMLASVEYAFSLLSRYGRPRSVSHWDISARPPRSATKRSSSHAGRFAFAELQRRRPRC
jgi:hypothetical protein